MCAESETAHAMNVSRFDGSGGEHTEPILSPLGLVDTKYTPPPAVVKHTFSADRLASFRRFQLRAEKLIVRVPSGLPGPPDMDLPRPVSCVTLGLNHGQAQRQHREARLQSNVRPSLLVGLEADTAAAPRESGRPWSR